MQFYQSSQDIAVVVACAKKEAFSIDAKSVYWIT